MAPVIDLTDKRKKKENLPQESSQPTPIIQKSEPIKVSPSNNSNKKSYCIKFIQTDLVAYATEDEPAAPIEEEYDPLKPNDYEKLSEELNKKKPYLSPNSNSSSSNDSRSSSNNNNNQNNGTKSYPGKSNGSNYGNYSRPRENRSELRPRYDDEDDYDTELPAKRANFGGAAFAPPPSLMENNEPSQSEPVSFAPPVSKTESTPKPSSG